MESSSKSTTIFRPTIQEFRAAVKIFSQSLGGRLWESDLEQLTELAYGSKVMERKGWRSFKKESEELDDGLVDLEVVIGWLDSTRQEDLIDPELEAILKNRRNRPNPGSFTNLVKTFSQYDTDSNGVICAKDLCFTLSALTGECPSIQDCRKMIGRVDCNEDGVVDISEFLEMMRGPRNQGRIARGR